MTHNKVHPDIQDATTSFASSMQLLVPPPRRRLHFGAQAVAWKPPKESDGSKKSLVVACQHIDSRMKKDSKRWSTVAPGHIKIPQSRCPDGDVESAGSSEPERCAHSKQAYDDFLEELCLIGQSAALPRGASIQERNFRDAQLHHHAASSIGFKRRLWTRARLNPYEHADALRPTTATLLTRERESSFSWFMLGERLFWTGGFLIEMALQIYAVYTFSQLDTATDTAATSTTSRTVSIVPESTSVYHVMLGALIIKEAFPITFVAFYALCALLASLIIFLASPALACLHYCSSEKTKLSVRRVIRIKIVPAVWDQVDIYATLFLSLSNLYRVSKLFDQLLKLELNESVRNSDVLLTRVANICFNVLSLWASENSTSATVADVSWFLLIFDMAALLRNMVAEKAMLETLYFGLKDVNENRLSKFELALFMLKLQEDFLKQDVQCNFIEHFVSDDPLKAGIESVTSEEVKQDAPPMPELTASMVGSAKESLAEAAMKEEHVPKSETIVSTGTAFAGADIKTSMVSDGTQPMNAAEAPSLDTATATGGDAATEELETQADWGSGSAEHANGNNADGAGGDSGGDGVN